jgi:hypothetical protein
MGDEKVLEEGLLVKVVCACMICGEETKGEYFRVDHLLNPHKLVVCKECFDGRYTCMQLADEYFSCNVDHLQRAGGRGPVGIRKVALGQQLSRAS